MWSTTLPPSKETHISVEGQNKLKNQSHMTQGLLPPNRAYTNKHRSFIRRAFPDIVKKLHPRDNSVWDQSNSGWDQSISTKKLDNLNAPPPAESITSKSGINTPMHPHKSPTWTLAGLYCCLIIPAGSHATLKEWNVLSEQVSLR